LFCFPDFGWPYSIPIITIIGIISIIIILIIILILINRIINLIRLIILVIILIILAINRIIVTIIAVIVPRIIDPPETSIRRGGHMQIDEHMFATTHTPAASSLRCSAVSNWLHV